MGLCIIENGQHGQAEVWYGISCKYPCGNGKSDRVVLQGNKQRTEVINKVYLIVLKFKLNRKRNC